MSDNIRENDKSINYSWKIKALSKNDEINASRWPFKVNREGDSEFKNMRSVTELNNSFKNTIYSNRKLVANRFGKILGYLQKNNIQNITHLYVAADKILFICDNKMGNVYSYTFGKEITEKYIQNLVLGIVQSVGALHKKIVKPVFSIVDKKYNPEEVNYIANLVSCYINEVKNGVLLLESNKKKTIADIFKIESRKSYGVSFQDLRYVILSNSFDGDIDIRMYLEQLMETYSKNIGLYLLQNSEIQDKLSDFVYLREEQIGFQQFKEEFKKGEKIPGLGSLEGVEIVSEKYDANNVAAKFRKMMEIEAQKIQEKEQEELKESLSDIKENVERIYDMLFVMNNIYKAVEKIGIEGVKIPFEYNVWIKNNYTSYTFIKRLDIMYKTMESKDSSDIPINKILLEVFPYYGVGESYDKIKEELGIFDKYVPTFFKNDSKSFESIGCSFTTKEGVKKVKELVKNAEVLFFNLFEMMLGLQYAMFGSYMIRYGMENTWLAKMKVKELDSKYDSDHRFVMSENVKYYANLSFYKIRVSDFSVGTVIADERKAKLGKETYFVMYYLRLLTSEKEINYIEDMEDYNSKDIATTFSSVGDISKLPEKEQNRTRMISLLGISSCILDILEECFKLISIQDIDFLEATKGYILNTLRGE